MPLALAAICRAAAIPLEAGGRNLSLGVDCTTACTAINVWNHAGEGWTPAGAPCDGWKGAGVVLVCVGCAGAANTCLCGQATKGSAKPKELAANKPFTMYRTKIGHGNAKVQHATRREQSRAERGMR